MEVLGIDIGFVDLVCQIGSPRTLATALQRVGRAGHWHGAVSRGYFFATTRDELVECAALVQAIDRGLLDELIIPEEPLDILMQQIVAICAVEDWHEEDLCHWGQWLYRIPGGPAPGGKRLRSKVPSPGNQPHGQDRRSDI